MNLITLPKPIHTIIGVIRALPALKTVAGVAAVGLGAYGLVQTVKAVRARQNAGFTPPPGDSRDHGARRDDNHRNDFRR